LGENKALLGSLGKNVNEDKHEESAPTDSAESVSALLEELAVVQSEQPQGNVGLGLAAFGLLLKRAAEGQQGHASSEVAPTNVVFEKVSVRGEAQEENVSVEIEYEIVVLRDGWSQVDLLPASLAIERIEILPVADEAAAASLAAVETQEAQPSTGTEESSPGQNDSLEPAQETSETSAYVGIRGRFYCLFSYGASRWRLKMSALSQYANAQKRSFAMWIPESLSSQIHFAVPKPGILIKVDPALQQTQTSLEAITEPKPRAACESITARLPPVHGISVNWVEPSVAGEGADLGEEKEQREVSVTAEQMVLASIGEGLVSYRMEWMLEILHGARFMFEIEIPPSLVVRNVTGSGIKRWEILSAHRISRSASSSAPAPSPSQSERGASPEAPPAVSAAERVEVSGVGSSVGGTAHTQQQQRDRRVLRIWHQTGAEGVYVLSIVAEEPLMSEGGQSKPGVAAGAPVPSGLARLMACKMVDVERQRGFVAVEARTNVEVNESGANQLTKIDSNELPPQMQAMAQSAVLCSYKFLAPTWTANFRIKRHEDVEVLVAVIDEAWLATTLVEEGKFQTRAELKVRNTTRQYLRMKLPENARIWSAEVNGTLVKPAFDASDSTVMVPLEKSSGESQGKESFWVDVVYIAERQPLTGRGTLDISLAQWDLPVNQLFVELFLPKKFKYGEFTGDIKEAKNGFSKGKLREEPLESYAGGGGLPRGRMGGIAFSNAAPMEQCKTLEPGFDDDDNEVEQQMYRQEDRSSSIPMKMSKKVGAYRSAGVKPVRVETIREGKCFRFERMLIDNEALGLSVRYVQLSDSFWHKRRLGLFS